MIKQAICMAVVGMLSGTPAFAAEKISVASNSLMPPFSETKDGQTDGLVVEIFRTAAERAGYQVEFVPVSLEKMEQTLADGRALAAIPMGITPTRRETLDFSSNLLMTGGALFVRAPDASPDGLRALAGKTVVTPRTGPLVAFIQKSAPEVKLVVTEDYESSLAKLVSGEADAAALNLQAGAILAQRLYPGKVTMPRTMFLELPFAAAVMKGRNGEFLSRLNDGLSAIRADGTFDAINTKWLSR